MDWRKLEWNNCDPPIDDARVNVVEELLGVRLPSDFRECAKHCHGGTPARRQFVVRAGELTFRSCLAVLLSFSEEDSENILQTRENLEDQLPAGMIPFAEDGGGDYICFDFGQTGSVGNPRVVYWHRSGLPENEFTFLAASFSAFLALLS